jgi:hypothetical protein
LLIVFYLFPVFWKITINAKLHQEIEIILITKAGIKLG